jgi:hypothetical protein
MKTFQTFVFAMAFVLLATLAASAQTYNVVTDFSGTSNPNGAWSYGYLTAPGTPLILYTATENDNCISGISFWGLYLGSCSLLPVVGKNDTTETVCWATDCLPPNYIVTSPGYTGQLNVVRWTAPASGIYQLSGAVMGTDYVYPTSTDFYVRLNGSLLFTTVVDSYDIPMTFGRRQSLRAGDTLDFVTDWGSNHNAYGDGTGFRAIIATVSDEK